MAQECSPSYNSTASCLQEGRKAEEKVGPPFTFFAWMNPKGFQPHPNLAHWHIGQVHGRGTRTVQGQLLHSEWCIQF